MRILEFLGLRKKPIENKPYPYKDILHLWEDDYLMLELVPYENLAFVKAETNRINTFAEEHFTDNGFTAVTQIADKPVRTIEKLIDLTEAEIIFLKAGLEKIKQFHMQDVGLLEGDKAPVGFGTNKFAVMCDRKKDLLENIWLTGHTQTEKEKHNLASALLEFGQAFNFIGVNWYRGEYYNLVERTSVEEFVKTSC